MCVCVCVCVDGGHHTDWECVCDWAGVITLTERVCVCVCVCV